MDFRAAKKDDAAKSGFESAGRVSCMSFDICVADCSLGVCGMSLLAREPRGALRARRVEEQCTSARLSARCRRQQSEKVYIIMDVIVSD